MVLMISVFLYIYFIFVKLTSGFQVQYENQESIQCFRERKPVIYCFWFEKIFIMLKCFNSIKPSILLTPQNRWDSYTIFATLLRIPMAKGSLESGGRHALLTLIDHIKDGHPVLISGDGARGPEKKMKTISLMVAQETKVPVIPVGVRSLWGIRIPVNGNRIYIPLPFNSIKLVLGSPIEIKPHLKIEELEGYKNQIFNTLNDLN